MPEQRKSRNSPPGVQNLRFQHSAGKSSPLEILRVADLRIRDSRIYEPTRLDFHLIKVVTEGSGFHWVDFESVELKRGDLLHIQPTQVHAFDRTSNHQALLLLFLPEAILNPNSLDPLNVHMCGTLHPEPADFELLLGILEAYEAQQSSRGSFNPARLAPYCLGSFLTAMGDLLSFSQPRRRATVTRAKRLVYDFEMLIHKHHASHRELIWYAQALNVTHRTLARACHAARGSSPKKLIDVRIALEAKRQLMLTPETVESLAFSLGFSDATNFVKFFKRIAGKTPEAFRDSQGPQHGCPG